MPNPFKIFQSFKISIANKLKLLKKDGYQKKSIYNLQWVMKFTYESCSKPKQDLILSSFEIETLEIAKTIGEAEPVIE